MIRLIFDLTSFPCIFLPFSLAFLLSFGNCQKLQAQVFCDPLQGFCNGVLFVACSSHCACSCSSSSSSAPSSLKSPSSSSSSWSPANQSPTAVRQSAESPCVSNCCASSCCCCHNRESESQPPPKRHDRSGYADVPSSSSSSYRYNDRGPGRSSNNWYDDLRI